MVARDMQRGGDPTVSRVATALQLPEGKFTSGWLDGRGQRQALHQPASPAPRPRARKPRKHQKPATEHSAIDCSHMPNHSQQCHTLRGSRPCLCCGARCAHACVLRQRPAHWLRLKKGGSESTSSEMARCARPAGQLRICGCAVARQTHQSMAPTPRHFLSSA